MSIARYRAGILGTLLAAGVLPLVGSLLANRFLPDEPWHHEPLHSAVEAGGALAGLTLAALLLVLRHYRRHFAAHLWTACALLSMGVLDALHACVSHGQAFVWLRSTATLTGGLLFALVWLPERTTRMRGARLLPLLTLAGSLLFGLLSLVFASSLPALVRDGEFTQTAHALNAVGGLGALAAAVYFLRRAPRGGPDELLFATLCLLFGSAGVLFLYSRAWTADWWWWHFLRLAGYLIVLGYTLRLFARTEQELKAVNTSLEKRVAERSAAAESRAAALARSEEDLRRQKQILQLILDQMSDAVIVADRDEKFLVFNPAAAQMFGRGFSDATASRWSEYYGLYYPDQTTPFAADDLPLVRSLNGQEVNNVEMFVRHESAPEGIWAVASGRPVRDAAGHLLGGVIVCHNVTQRKRAEEALRLSEERTRSVLDHVLDGVVTINARGLVESFNPAAERLFGYAADEVIGQSVKLLMPEDYRRDHDAGLMRFLQTGQARILGTTVEVVGRRKDGSTFALELATSTFRLGERRYFTGIIRDITGRKRAEEELRRARDAAEEASRAKSEFLANMSHEIRTPMHGILGMTGLALETSLTPEQREYLGMAKGSAESLLGIINDILDFSKIEARKLELECLDFSLRDAVGDTLSALALRAQGKGLELAGHVQPDVADALAGDPGRLRQVLLNLVGNALKFTERGEVVVRVTPEPSLGEFGLHFAVSDTGIGIPADKRDRVFEAFTQAESSTTRRYGGTGLGLTICARLVGLMGGRIWVDSEVGKGSTFHFTASLRRASGPVPSRPVPPGGSLRGLRVLVVDDNATNRLIFSEQLASWGMKPVAVENARDGLATLVAAARVGEPFPLVLLDAMMPGTDGFRLAAAIREDPQLHRAVLLMLSSAGRIEDAQRCRELGIAACLTKPVKEAELLQAILTALQVAPTNEPPAAAAAAAVPPTRPLKVLLAEDNPVNQRLAVRLLEKQGHAVVVVGDGRQALAALEGGSFDVVLMDVQMPEMDGLAATEALRQREQATGGRMPVLAMTAYAMKGDRERCLAAGMDGYLSKPIQPNELWQALAQIAARLPAAEPVQASPSA
jgi:PAS domain S-box-containing protein